MSVPEYVRVELKWLLDEHSFFDPVDYSSIHQYKIFCKLNNLKPSLMDSVKAYKTSIYERKFDRKS